MFDLDPLTSKSNNCVDLTAYTITSGLHIPMEDHSAGTRITEDEDDELEDYIRKRSLGRIGKR